jgi:hypothetical protein
VPVYVLFPVHGIEFPVGPVWIRGATLDHQGRLFSGFVCADRTRPDALTAFFSASVNTGYTVSPEPESRGRARGAATKQARDLGDVVRLAQEWEL